MKLRVWRNNQFIAFQPNIWDIVALLLVFLLLALLAWNALQITAPYHVGEELPIYLAPKYLPYYALRTIFRMAIGLTASLIFTFAVGYLAAKNKHAERIIIPLIDIFQSVPVLGFLSITIVGFIELFPNSMLGPECAAIFAGIFTAQAWNMCLGFYQSLRMIPLDLREASSMLQLSAWQRFWRVEVPFAMPSLIWNTMMSLSASWFFVVAAEAISVNNQTIMLPGIGSYIATAINHSDKTAILYAIITMLVVILLYDQLFFRPLIHWSEKFKSESNDIEYRSTSLFLKLIRRTKLFHYIGDAIAVLFDAMVNFRASKRSSIAKPQMLKKAKTTLWLVIAWYSFISLIGLTLLTLLIRYLSKTVTLEEVWHVVILGSYTSMRIIILIIICSVIWVPIGVWVGLKPRVAQFAQPIAQFLASFPANLLFPVVFMLIIKYKLNVQIWTTPLMILGTQWYILFNVIAGTTALPKDLIQVAQNFSVRKWLWWKRFILPGIFPYFITGAITAAGGAWNASIVAEIVSWGHTTLIASGLGAYITQASRVGDFPKLALGIAIMCLYVLLFNRLIWQPLYNLAEKRFQLD